MSRFSKTALLLAIGPAFFDGGKPIDKLEFELTEPARAANPKSRHEKLKVQPKLTAMKMRTRR